MVRARIGAMVAGCVGLALAAGAGAQMPGAGSNGSACVQGALVEVGSGPGARQARVFERDARNGICVLGWQDDRQTARVPLAQVHLPRPAPHVAPTAAPAATAGISASYQAQRDKPGVPANDYERDYCRKYGEMPLGRPCAPGYGPPKGSGTANGGAQPKPSMAKNSCDVAWSTCWNSVSGGAGHAGGANAARMAQCNAQKFACYKRLGVTR